MISSPRKIAKKAGQVFRKNQLQLMQDMIRPKSRWIPWKVYLWLLGLFLKIDKE